MTLSPTLAQILSQADPAVQALCDKEKISSAVCIAVHRATGSELLATALGTMVPAALKILAILVLAYVLSRVVKRLIKRFVAGLKEQGIARLGNLRGRAPLADTAPIDLSRATMRTETIGGVLRSLSTFTIWGLAVLMILGTVGLELGPLIAGAGIVGVALGFGAQNLVRDFLSGIFMLLEDQYGVGDIIDAGEATGTVEAVSLRTTRLRDVEGVVWHVPNGTISRVGNMSQQWARSLLDIAVAYDTDVAHASAVIKRVADELWQDPEWSDIILEEPDVWGLHAFGPSELVIRLVVKTQPLKQWTVSRQLRARLKAAFDAEGIEIPFPQRTVWMHQANGDSTAPQDHPVPVEPAQQEAPDHGAADDREPAERTAGATPEGDDAGWQDTVRGGGGGERRRRRRSRPEQNS